MSKTQVAGQPRKNTSKPITVWLDETFHKAAKKRAKSLGLSVSAYFRFLTNKDIAAK